MSLKRFAMLSTISSHNQLNYNNNSSNNNNSNYNKTSFEAAVASESTTKSIISNKSTLIQLKQQHQQQQQSPQIIASIFLDNTNNASATTTTTTTSGSTISTPSSPPLTHAAHGDKTSTSTIENRYYNNNNSRTKEIDDSLHDIIDDDSSQYSSESSESLDLAPKTANERRQPSNTYTSTTYYGSGFGVFHQQNVRNNNGGGGGGIALISGSSATNSLNSGSYSHGINNNVNFLLGGAMLTLITTILCVVCYCCHRNIKKRTEAAYRQQRQWLENDPNMEIYSVEQCYETSGLFVGDSMDGLATIPALHHEPPPSYDAVVAMQEQQQLIMQQQHQQQILMQQQLLQQQLSTNNSPPPGYRSSLDVSSILQQSRGTGLGALLTVDGSVISGLEINSLASSNNNLRTIPSSLSPIHADNNYNDINGNLAATVPAPTASPTNNRTAAAACYLHNKQQQQQPQQRTSAASNHQMSQLTMKKVLQAQSCCSLQRAEVENMWNAAAAALAARSAHLPSDSRASTSSPTLAMNTHKQMPACKTSNPNTPETFGTRYLKQNYYRRGCPLCGKFRYDYDSSLSISMESNLDTLAGALTQEVTADAGQENSLEATQNTVSKNYNNNSESPTNCLNNNSCEEEEEISVDNNETGVSENEMNDHDDETEEQQCSCLKSSKRKNELNSAPTSSCENANLLLDKLHQNQIVERTESELSSTAASALQPTPDNNANTVLATETRQLTSPAAPNNNNDSTNLQDTRNLSSAAAIDTATTLPRSPDTAAASTSSAASSPSVAINLDCINDNGIISLDMSKIIDKTGLPTYDAALKLESSGYV